MQRKLARFWYRFKNRFRTRPGPGKPLKFVCGSEEELRRVTTWMCHVRPCIFAECESAVVEYGREAEADPLEGVLLGAWESDGSIQVPPVPDAEREHSERWCSWVVQHNAFQGTEWGCGQYLFAMAGLQWFWGPRMPGSCREAPLGIQVIVSVPSAHEQAEALLSLYEWLDGKVSEGEMRELLQLPDDITF